MATVALTVNFKRGRLNCLLVYSDSNGNSLKTMSSPLAHSEKVTIDLSLIPNAKFVSILISSGHHIKPLKRETELIDILISPLTPSYGNSPILKMNGIEMDDHVNWMCVGVFVLSPSKKYTFSEIVSFPERSGDIEEQLKELLKMIEPERATATTTTSAAAPASPVPQPGIRIHQLPLISLPSSLSVSQRSLIGVSAKLWLERKNNARLEKSLQSLNREIRNLQAKQIKALPLKKSPGLPEPCSSCERKSKEIDLYKGQMLEMEATKALEDFIGGTSETILLKTKCKELQKKCAELEGKCSAQFKYIENLRQKKIQLVKDTKNLSSLAPRHDESSTGKDAVFLEQEKMILELRTVIEQLTMQLTLGMSL
jgi:hypothetical protein